MKKTLLVKLILFMTLLFSITTGWLLAEQRNGKTNLPGPRYKADTGQFDGNRIRDDLENNGMVVSHRITGHSGMEWPKDSHLYINFASGIWVAGKVSGDIRTAVGEYGPEFVAGPWGGDAGAAEHQLYIVNKSDLADPLSSDDFMNWPVDLGAPWVDEDGDGAYEPLEGDHPEFLGDQVIWWVMNDSEQAQHSIFNTLPVGIEMQMTVWGYDRPDAFGDMMFVKALMINKGGVDIDSTIIGLWADPDLGDAGDDFVGCDTLLSLGFCYNDGADNDYGADAPAIGYDFFQGPIVESSGDTAFAFGRYIPGYKNLGMSSFTKYINGDPVYTDPNSAVEAYNYMSGFLRDGTPFVNSETGLASMFVHPDDPNLNTGAGDGVWVDSDDHASGDRRFLMNAGPFTLADGDSQEVVFGMLIARGNDALSSITALKQADALAQLAYDIQFALPPSPSSPNVAVTTQKAEILLNWDNGINAVEKYTALDVIDKLPVPVAFDTTWTTDIVYEVVLDTVIEGQDTTITTDTTYSFIQIVDHIDTTFEGQNTEFNFQGYNVYQLETASGQGDKKRIATYDIVDGITEIFDDVFDPALGETINRRVQFGSDSGIKRFIAIDNDALNSGAPLKTNRAYYFAVTAYGYNPYGIPKTLESSMNILTVRPQMSTTWNETDNTANYGDVIASVHSEGGSDGTIQVNVIDPTALTGDDYQLYFDMGHYYLDVDGYWKPTAYPDSVGKMRNLGKFVDCSGSAITAAAIVSTTVGTVDLTLTFDMDCGDNWVDGIMLDLPDDLVINSWESVSDCNYAAYGQNCVNPNGTLDATTNTLVWGDSARSEIGAIEQGRVWTINIQPPANYPFDIDYQVYDDGYDGTIIDAIGTAIVSELGYEFKSIQQWNVRNVTTGALVVEDQTMISGVYYENIVDGEIVSETAELGENANPIFDGFQVFVNGPSNGIHGIWQTQNASGAISGVDENVNENILWLNFLTAPDNPSEQAQGGWVFVTHGGGTANDWDSFYDRVFRGSNFDVAIPNDFEMRFTGSTGKAWMAFSSESVVDVPFECWNIGTTPDDPSDDVRMVNWIYDLDGDDTFSFSGDDPSSGGNNDPSSDWIYWRNPTDMTPGQSGYEACANSADYGYSAGAYGVETMARTRLMNWNRYLGGGGGGAQLDSAAAELARPETGTVLRWITNKPNTTTDKFTFSTSTVAGVTVDYDPKTINVWPNPYFAYNPEERSPLERRMTFTHLPEEGTATIRIYNLAGELVRKIVHDNGTQYEVWDLANNFNIPVASGMYIAHIETESGAQILKLAVVQPEERIDVY